MRVSSHDQNTARQDEAIGIDALDRVFVDRASGSNRERPALAELLAYVREGDVVVVASMDRLARSLRDLHDIVDHITSKGAAVEFVKEGVTYRPDVDATSRLLLGILGSIAEFERTLIRERQAEGIAIAKAAGRYRGGQRKLSEAQVATARERVDAGVPKAKVARELGIDRTSLYRYLAN